MIVVKFQLISKTDSINHTVTDHFSGSLERIALHLRNSRRFMPGNITFAAE